MTLYTDTKNILNYILVEDITTGKCEVINNYNNYSLFNTIIRFINTIENNVKFGSLRNIDFCLLVENDCIKWFTNKKYSAMC